MIDRWTWRMMWAREEVRGDGICKKFEEVKRDVQEMTQPVMLEGTIMHAANNWLKKQHGKQCYMHGMAVVESLQEIDEESNSIEWHGMLYCPSQILQSWDDTACCPKQNGCVVTLFSQFDLFSIEIWCFRIVWE